MLSHYAGSLYAECRVLFMILLKVIILSVIMLSVIILSAIMLRVVAPIAQHYFSDQ